MYKHIYLLACGLTVLFTSACNDDFLERYPTTEVTEATAFVSYATSYAYCRTMYGVFTYNFFPGPAPVSSAMGTSQQDVYSGLLTNYNNGYGTYPSSYAARTVTIPSSTPNEYYVPYYYIRMANIMLSHIDEPDCTDEERLHLEAVARFFRAYCHLGLMMNYGDVIYADYVLTDASEELTGSRDSRLYVSQQIYEELEWCIDTFESISGAGIIEENTINADVCRAIMSRFCLFEGTWRKYHNVDESEANVNGYVTGTQLLQKCVDVSKELMDKRTTLFQGENEGYPGPGWGQIWTQDDLSSQAGETGEVILYMKYIVDYKMHRIGQYQHIATAQLEMPQSTVNLYLTKDGLPIKNANVKYYEFDANVSGYYTEITNEDDKYDYRNCDIYKTFRNRDPRMWQTIMPPYHVIRTGGANDFAYDDRFDQKFREYLFFFPCRGLLTGEGTYDYDSQNTGLDVYTLVNPNSGYYLIPHHKALPSGNWGGNIQNNVPNTNQGTNNETIVDGGDIMYSSNTAFQKGKSGYFVWKHHAGWDMVDPNYTSEIADKPLIKMPEILLNYAEAQFELGSFNQSVADETINKLRERAEVGLMTVGDIDENFDPSSDKDNTIDPVLWEIRRERLIELMGEGFSFMDVKRWRRGDFFMNKQHYGVFVEDATASGIVSQTGGETGILLDGGTREATAVELAEQGGGGHLYYYLDPTSAGTGWMDAYYLYPIPSNEILLNPNLGQNPGW